MVSQSAQSIHGITVGFGDQYNHEKSEDTTSHTAKIYYVSYFIIN